MEPVTIILFISLLSHCAESTDLVFSYLGDIKLLQNAESTEMSIGDLPFGLKFGFPMALHYVEKDRQLLLSDFDNDDVDIYSISLDNNTVQPVIKSVATTQIESITYDPLLHKLYWSDGFRYGIYTNSTNSRPQMLHESRTMQPRSITLDSCNQILYWSDRNVLNPMITAYDLIKKRAEVFKSSTEGTFYHGITFDSYDNQLWWFETNGDVSSKSSCNIMKKMESGSLLYTMLDHCYPFAITFDENYLYWNDWGREALMRLSKTNPSDVVELLSTPTNGEARAYGIANVNRTNHFDCDITEVLEQEISPVEELPTASYSDPELKEEKTKMSSNVFTFTLFPDRSTSMADMKKIYNKLHRVELAIILLCLIFTMIGMGSVINLYVKRNNTAKKYLKSNTIAGDSLPTFEVNKSARKYKRFAPIISASQGQHNNTSVDIEDCCQMTLCDKPCEIARNHSVRFSAKPKKREDKHRLLDDSIA